MTTVHLKCAENPTGQHAQSVNTQHRGYKLKITTTTKTKETASIKDPVEEQGEWQ